MIKGTCHCEAVQWSYDVPLESVTACNCTLCRRYGALWAYGHLHDGIEVSGDTKFYERNSKHNGFHFCSNCGCVCYYMANKKNADGKYRIAVNLRMSIDPMQFQSLPIDHFEGLDKFEDEPRDGRCVKDMWY
jgi:hypothetical protein